MSRTNPACPICRTELRDLTDSSRIDISVEGTKKYSTPVTIRVCPSCGNTQQFMDLNEIRPLLH